MKISVIMQFTFEGFHSWPGVTSTLASEQYLRYEHRHLFHVRAVKAVNHEERDVEFIEYRRHLWEFCIKHFRGPHSLSCESMAVELVKQFSLERCSVLEDGENGAEAVNSVTS